MIMGPTIAVLWDSEVDWDGGKPFKKDYINSSYAVFSQLAEERGAEILIGKFSWYRDNGLEKAYRYRNGEWSKAENVEIDGIFDKFKFGDETVDIKKKMHDDLPVLNSYELEEICKDKLLTYDEFPGRVPETRGASEENVVEMLQEYGSVVLKPRYDFGGKGVRIIDSMKEFEPEDDLLVQRFIDSESGIPELDIEGVHDLRVIVVNGEKAASFVRTPDEGLISNVSRGGSMHHIEVEDIPERAVEIVDEVEDRFSQFGNRVYAVDFIFDENGRPWILEMNSKPGLVFYDDEDVRSWKEPLMEKVVETLIEMAR
ncbi:MAG: glutathione synthase/RimK-type ligase-like ATP-grasp enzyme [Candidatus Nanohaloarchaea archaeon]|jgi:glutathione synthase/RimK-type ligase-like ATP-grasp enzyme